MLATTRCGPMVFLAARRGLLNGWICENGVEQMTSPGDELTRRSPEVPVPSQLLAREYDGQCQDLSLFVGRAFGIVKSSSVIQHVHFSRTQETFQYST